MERKPLSMKDIIKEIRKESKGASVEEERKCNIKAFNIPEGSSSLTITRINDEKEAFLNLNQNVLNVNAFNEDKSKIIIFSAM